VGTGRGAIDAASSYAQERRQFGKSIAEFQGIQWKLADMATEIEAAGLMAQRAAYLASSGRPFAHEAAMAKLLASEAARRVADHAVQIHGGFGFTADFPAERIYRDAQMASVALGSPAALRGLIGTGVLAG
jgi:alkylation response protein AidB-like acyl-CoA dehydrogenase